jgi:cytochrome c
MKKIYVVLGLLSLLSSFSYADQALATSKNCMACHAVANKVVGPAFVEVSKKYAGKADVVDVLANKVIKGGSGNWGTMPMMAHPSLSPTDAKKLVQWILTLK